MTSRIEKGEGARDRLRDWGEAERDFLNAVFAPNYDLYSIRTAYAGLEVVAVAEFRYGAPVNVTVGRFAVMAMYAETVLSQAENNRDPETKEEFRNILEELKDTNGAVIIPILHMAMRIEQRHGTQEPRETDAQTR